MFEGAGGVRKGERFPYAVILTGALPTVGDGASSYV